MNQRPVIGYDPTLICFGSDILKIVTVFVLLYTKNTHFFNMRVNFGRLLHPLPPFAIHILNRLGMRIHQVASKICHTHIKTEHIAIE